MTPNEMLKRADQIMKSQPTEALLDLWEMTTNCNDDVSTLRGWLMDELEERHPEAFEAWLDDDARDEDLRRYIEEEIK